MTATEVLLREYDSAMAQLHVLRRRLYMAYRGEVPLVSQDWASKVLDEARTAGDRAVGEPAS